MFPNLFPSHWPVSVHYDPDRRRFVVRWREDGRQRSRRFRLEADAAEFDQAMGAAPGRQRPQVPEPVRQTSGDGVYAYSTGAGVRYRFVFRQSDGTPSSRRGFKTRQAALAARREVLESVKRLEITVCREDFSSFWACSDAYRPLAAFLIGTGARISEAVATRWADVDLEEGVARIYRQRERDSSGTRPTKGKRFRSVQMGPRLSETLRGLRLSRLSHDIADDGWIFLCPPPRRGRYAGRTEPVPPHRRTVHEWHEAALQDAGLRDMPLHSLRHTAAASWLAAGHPLMFVMRQLGHRAVTTTEEYYGHLEGSFVKGAAARTEAAIIDARRLARPTGSGDRDAQ